VLSETVPRDKFIGYGFDSPAADFMGKDLQLEAHGVTFALETGGERYDVRLNVPGRHNASNALAALASVSALGVRLEDAVTALARFDGLKRRLETVGEGGGVTVIDDFAHNPDKIAATLATLRAQPGRLLIMFQPHGYGPLTKMGEALAASLADGMALGDRLYLPDPVYHGGTVERVRGSDWLADQVRAAGKKAEHISERPKIGDAMVAEAEAGDRILIMGARDDTLIEFARELVERLAETESA
jgi:UDP-N-acetylmuramate--alanine ligase